MGIKNLKSTDGNRGFVSHGRKKLGIVDKVKGRSNQKNNTRKKEKKKKKKKKFWKIVIFFERSDQSQKNRNDKKESGNF